MKFTKMQGCGNDYIYVCGETVKNPSRVARLVSDRHYGIGADGLILILPSRRADFRMRMYNADGSEGEMCGNGVRCIGKYLYERRLTRKTDLDLETRAGLIRLRLFPRNGRVDRVCVDMGPPRIVTRKLYSRAGGDRLMERGTLAVGGKHLELHVLSMGNPHCVIPLRGVEALPIERFGPPVERHRLFPARTNVEFVEVVNRREIVQRTWERGSGETLACGTGASAVTAAMVMTRRCEREITIHLRGGDLDMEYGADGHMYMTGPAVEVCTGTWLPPQ